MDSQSIFFSFEEQFARNDRYARYYQCKIWLSRDGCYLIDDAGKECLKMIGLSDRGGWSLFSAMVWAGDWKVKVSIDDRGIFRIYFLWVLGKKY